jgi:hypothetical protein
MADGFRYVAGNPALRGIIAAEGFAFVFFYFAEPVVVVYANRSLHAGSNGYGAMLTAWGVGIVAGSLLQVRMARRAGPTMILVSTLLVAAAYLGTAVAPNLALACVASVVGGIGNGTQWAAVETVVHRLVSEQFRARVAAMLETLVAIAPGPGILAGGALAASWSPRAAYAVAGVGLCVLIGGGLVTGGNLFAAARVESAATGAEPSGDGAEPLRVWPDRAPAPAAAEDLAAQAAAALPGSGRETSGAA